MIRVAICGGSGYTGCELLRLLSGHPGVEVTAVTSERSAGKPVTSLFPHLIGFRDLFYEPLQTEGLLNRADVFFMALPHGASQEAVDYFARKGKKVVDLSADYRLKDASVYEEWYNTPHGFKATIKKAVYGLPELYRKKIASAGLVANPGCYPTGAILGLYPALKAGLADASSIVIDSKSGASGAGRKADVSVSFCEVNEGFKAYGIATHRHTPEIEQELSALAKTTIKVDFTPHLLPVDRGILTTIYVKSKTGDLKRLRKAYERAYEGEPFVRLLEENTYPNLNQVKGTNYCFVGLTLNKRTGSLIIVTAMDNLVKGASGQAIQNMNIMLGLDETTGLKGHAVFP